MQCPRRCAGNLVPAIDHHLDQQPLRTRRVRCERLTQHPAQLRRSVQSLRRTVRVAGRGPRAGTMVASEPIQRPQLDTATSAPLAGAELLERLRRAAGGCTSQPDAPPDPRRRRAAATASLHTSGSPRPAPAPRDRDTGSQLLQRRPRRCRIRGHQAQHHVVRVPSELHQHRLAAPPRRLLCVEHPLDPFRCQPHIVILTSHVDHNPENVAASRLQRDAQTKVHVRSGRRPDRGFRSSRTGRSPGSLEQSQSKPGDPIAGRFPAADGDFDVGGFGLDESPSPGGLAVAGRVLDERLDRDV